MRSLPLEKHFFKACPFSSWFLVVDDASQTFHMIRSSHQRCSIWKGVLINFTNFTGKQLCQNSFFNKVEGLRPTALLKKRLWHRCFSVNFVIFLRTPFLQNTSGRLVYKWYFKGCSWYPVCSSPMKCGNALMQVYSEPRQTSVMEIFVKIINSLKLLTILTKSSILDFRVSSE